MALNEEEFEQLRSLLKRFCAEDLDQWALWKTDTGKYGEVFIDISRQCAPGASPDAYDPL